MGDIKSAYEKAMEKVESLGKPSQEELRKWKYVPQGQKLAAAHLREESNLTVELRKYDDEVKQYVIKGAEEILVRPINLPRNDFAKSTNKRAMEGIKALKSDKASLENVYSKIRRIFNHYEQEGEQQRKQAYEALKQELQVRFQQASQQQLGLLSRVNVDVERQPQFQEEWRRTLARLDSQYNTLLQEYRQEILGIA